jgi:glycosyltransferase involved in cell wall biosynthesis
VNILQLSKYYFPYSGGIESVVRELVIGLKTQKNLNISVAASNDKKVREEDVIDQVEITRIPEHLNLFSQPISFTLVYDLRTLIKDKAIIHLHTPNPIWELVLLFLLKKNQVWIITHHSDIVNQKLLAPIVMFIQRLIYKRVDAFIVPTKNHMKYSKILCHFKEKCHLIPFAFRFDEIFSFRPEVNVIEEIKKKFTSYAIFIGRIVPYKGLKVAIDAMRLIDKNHQLVIIGDGPQKALLQNYVQENGLQSQIHFLGKLPNEKLYHLLYCSQYLILPSLNQSENFGIVQLEAFAMKKPVVVANLRSGASSLIINEENGLLTEPGNARDLAEKMQTLFNSPKRSSEMGERAFTHLINNYSFETMITKHNELYQLLLEHKRKS